MSDVIRLLPDSVANQIAAGEVVQRPASVIKELVENSIDAGATEIQILIEDAGRTNIQIIDNGKGMSQTDARLSFERHATSKIQGVNDLYALTTMGFRGEALASIAAVAQVELKTRTADEELGTLLEIAGSKVQRQEVISCPVGCNFSVKNLFFNIPARRKFLKSNQVELSHILTEFERIALVYPQVRFTLHSNGQELFNLPEGNHRQRILQLFGKKLSQQLLPVEVQTTLIQIQGFVAKPDASRKKGAQTYFFANNRYMRHPYFHKAVMEAYSQLIPQGDQISYFLYFTLPPAEIDVNIHPTKTEIKFTNDVPIWQIIMAAVREAIGRFESAPRIDFDTEDRPDIPVFSVSPEDMPEEPRIEYDPSYNPFQNYSGDLYAAGLSSVPAASGSAPSYSAPRRTKVEWEELYKDLAPAGKEYALRPDEAEEQGGSAQAQLYTESASPLEAGYQPFQMKGRYLLLAVKSGIMIIDQRRAHIRVLFDTYLSQLERKQGFSQRMLFPEMLELSPAEGAFLKNIEEELNAIGFDLSDLGGGSYSINAAPAGIEGISPTRLVTDLLHASMEKGSDVKDQVHYELALTMARSSAIVYGQVLATEETTKLIDSLFATKMSNYTPDGKSIYTILREDELERMFR